MRVFQHIPRLISKPDSLHSEITLLSDAICNPTRRQTGLIEVPLKLNRGTADNSAIATDGIAGTSGDIVINGGTLEIAAAEQIGNNGSIAMSSGAFNFGAATGKTETIGTFSNSGGAFTTGANTLIGTGASITWSGGTNTVGNGGLVQDGHVTITGGTNIAEGGASGGVLEVLGGGAGLEFGGTGSPTLTLNSDNSVAGRLKLSGNVTVLNSLTGGSNAGAVDLAGGTRTFTVNNGTAATDLLVSASIANGSLTKAGAGTMTLTGGGTDQLLLTSAASNGSITFSNIDFFSDDGLTQIGFGFAFVPSGLGGEIVPVPEPSSVATGPGLLGLIGWREGRRGRKS